MTKADAAVASTSGARSEGRRVLAVASPLYHILHCPEL